MWIGAVASALGYGAAMARRTRVAAYLVAIADRAIVLSRIAPGYPGAGSWTLPGGGVEWGEHPEDALRREVFEEAGFVLDAVHFVGIDSRVYDADGRHTALHAIRLIYTADVAGTPRVTEDDGSVDAARWFPLADLPTTPTVDLVEAGLRLLDPPG